MESVWRRFFKNIIICLLIAIPLFFFGVKIGLFGGIGGAFVGVGCAALAGLILSLPFPDLIANPVKGLFFPSAQFAKPILSYARADLYIRTEKYQEAAEEFEAILKYYPQEVQALIGKLCLMVQFAQKNDKATALYYSNLKKLSDGEAHKKLVEAYAMILAKKDVIVRKPSDLVYFTIYLSEQMPAFRRV